MSREFQPIVRIEGEKFAPPTPPTESGEKVTKEAQASAPMIYLPRAFWEDLEDDLEDPEFAAEYEKAQKEIQKEQE